ncbi:MAG: hypothetical protein D6820_14155 [Lentisphaerae bacterium]|nr:MAG: hypothetical protein D6820_14155 [Lentisphaerota bacterium]
MNEPRDIDGLTQMQDILPTLIDLCSLNDAETDGFDGLSLAGALRGSCPVPADRTLFINYSRMPNFDFPTPASQAVMRKEETAVLWQRWRLIENSALYNLERDPLQEHNVIDEYPQIARMLSQRLDAWWESVESLANEPQAVTIGSDHENPTILTGCEWRDVFLDQQQQIRAGVYKNSYWHLDVDRPGTYRFELRRWPFEADLPLSQPAPEETLVDGILPCGRSIPIAGARIHIAGHDQRVDLEPEAKSAVFTLSLPAGPALLHTWFLDEAGQGLTGAYYVKVTRLT